LKLKTTGSKDKFPNKRSFLLVSAPLDNEPVPCVMQPSPISIDKLGIVGKGKLCLGARVDDTHIGRGQTLDIYLACRNLATCDIVRVEVKLVEEYQWTARSWNWDGKCTLVDTRNVNLPGLKRPAIPRAQVDEMNESKGEMEETIARQINRDLHSIENNLALTIPDHARDTFIGSVIKITHYVKLTLFTMSTVSHPSTRIPIKIGEPSSMLPSNQPAVSGLRNVVKVQHTRLDNSIHMPPLASAAPNNMLLGRSAYYAGLYDSTMIMSSMMGAPNPSLLPTAKAFGSPSVSLLLDEMSGSVNDFDIIASKIKDIEWAIILASLTPEEFGDIIGHINLEFSQPRVGAFLARHVAEGFTFAHCVAAVQNTSESFRPNMVRALLPYCVDLVQEHQQTIRGEELSEYEQLIVTWETLGDDRATEHEPNKDPEPPGHNRIREEEESIDILPSSPPKSTSSLEVRDHDASVEPLEDDICIGIGEHPGTMSFYEAAFECAAHFSNPEYSSAVYRKIKKKVKGRRFLIRQFYFMVAYWREASQRERAEFVETSYDAVRAYSHSEEWGEESKGAVKEWKDELAHENNQSKKSLHSAKDTWELAVTHHSYDDGQFDEEEGDDVSYADVCFGIADHPGNFSLYRVIRKYLMKSPDTTTKWSPCVYREIRRQMHGRRYFVGLKKADWREATQHERIECMGFVFNAEKEKIKEEAEAMVSAAPKSPEKRSSASTDTSLSPGKRPNTSLSPQKRSSTDKRIQRSKSERASLSKSSKDRSSPRRSISESADYKCMRPPQEYDICFGSERHPGTISFHLAILQCSEEFSHTKWSPPVYKAIRRLLEGRNFFVRSDSKPFWREANQDERICLFQEAFEKDRHYLLR
jgi:hypothetical protein